MISITKSVLWLILSIVSAGSMVYYVIEIWGYGQPAHFSDLYAPWWGSHELLLHKRNPYSPAVAHEIQTVIYGAPVNPSATDPSGMAGGFAYPPYAAFLLWPAVYMSFSAAQKVFLCASVLAVLLSLAFWLRALSFRASPLHWLTFALFVLGSFPVLQGLELQNLSLIASALIAVTAILLSTNHLVLAGIFLAASTFKPQFTVALIPWLVLWSFADWHRRRSLVWSFLLTMLFLILASEWLMPGSISSFLHIVRAYRHYTYGHSLLDVWLTPTLGPFASAILLVSGLTWCWPDRSQSADSPRFIAVISLLLAATIVVIPTLAPHAQLLLLPGFLSLLRGKALLLRSDSVARVVPVAAWALLAWPWVAAFGLLAASLRHPPGKLLAFWEVPLYTSPLLPLAVLLALGCLVRSTSGPVGQEVLGTPSAAP